jgi:hypothetical protein
MPWWHQNLYYDMHSQYNFYINANDRVVLKQKCQRFFEDITKDPVAMKDLIHSNRKFLKLVKKAIEVECNQKLLSEHMAKWSRDYKAMGYEFDTANKIYNKVCSILRHR